MRNLQPMVVSYSIHLLHTLLTYDYRQFSTEAEHNTVTHRRKPTEMLSSKSVFLPHLKIWNLATAETLFEPILWTTLSSAMYGASSPLNLVRGQSAVSETETWKPHCRKKPSNHTMPYIAALFGLKFADSIQYKFKSSQASKACRLRRSKNTGAKHNLTQNGHSRSLKVTCFGVSGKAMRDWVNTNVGLIC